MFSASKPKGASGSYQIANSLRFRSSASAYLTRTESAGNRTTWTWSGWIKRGALGSGLYTPFAFGDNSTGATDVGAFFRLSSDTLYFIEAHSGVDSFNLTTTQVFRDPSAWYHFVFSVDTTQASSSNRIKIYVNGAQITSFSTATYPSQNFATSANQSGQSARIGVIDVDGAISGQYFDGYLAEINFIDGQALTPSSFGQISTITGVWQPKAYSGSYGTNGFKLNFSNGTSTTTLGYDSSGNSNNWTTNNISLTAGSTYDWVLDSPTPFAGSSYGVGNYAVLNPVNTAGTSITTSNGNLSATYAGASWFTIGSTMAMVGSGKYYFEFTKTDTSTQMVGICPTTASLLSFVGNDANGWGYLSSNGNLYNNSGASTAFGATYTNGDVVGVAFDAGTGKLWFSKNGTWQASGNPASGTSPAATVSLSYSYIAGFSTSSTGVGTANFGQRPFSYTPPTGYKSLCTYNLPAASIVNGASYMAATTYTGTGATQSLSNAVNGVSFQPDFVWVKNRSLVQSNVLQDSVRGNYRYLSSDTTAAENTNTGYDWFKSFDSNGFTVAYTSSNSTTASNWNASGSTFVAWQWKAGNLVVSNTQGTITSQVSPNTTAGFSVVTYTGTGANATVGHGLGVAPSFIIVKNRTSSTFNWAIYHQSVGATQWLQFTTSAAITASNVWNNTAPTSSVFSIGTASTVNDATTFVAYCFAAIAGYSAFGSYTGNGSTDGPFIYCGFRPRYILIKNTSATYGWDICDTSRAPYNEAQTLLYADTSGAELTNTVWGRDILSNGFKIRNNGQVWNTAGNVYIYAAFAENPFQNSLAR